MIPYLAAVAVLSALVLAVRPRVPAWVALAHALGIALLVAASFDQLGHPKPSWAEWRDVSGLPVKHFQIRPGRGIYVWTAEPVPRAFRLPWNPELAERLSEREKGAPHLRLDPGQVEGDAWLFDLGGDWKVEQPRPGIPDKE